MSQRTTAAPVSASHTQHRVRHIGLWVLQAVTAILILGAGITTLAGAAQVVATFDMMGTGQWFRYLTGILQVAAALGLLIPRLAGLAALALAALWLVAIATHLFVIGGSPVAAVVLFVLSTAIAWGRWDHIRDLLLRR